MEIKLDGAPESQSVEKKGTRALGSLKSGALRREHIHHLSVFATPLIVRAVNDKCTGNIKSF